MPYAAYRAIPEYGGVDMKILMEIMPPYESSAIQLKWTEMLTSYHYDRLGHYDEIRRPVGTEPGGAIPKGIDDVEQQIDNDNKGRPVAYNYFKPSKIINSINT